ncbi:transposase [Pigmentiphaga litoralis]|uniref:transposase n=1 Tax=Pigmentiphaga litoralis TaxID=516702 RepID=UPI003B43ACEE
MARLPRLYAPGLPHLAQARFTSSLAPSEGSVAALFDRVAGWLADESRLHGVALHGWTLAPDQLLLLATPAGPTGLAGLLQAIGRRLAAHLRSGPVFQGRYRSTLVEPGAWVLPAQAWVETLPLRLSLTDDAEQWRWSSAAAHMGGAKQPFLHDHGDYWAYGNTPFDRQAKYRRYVLAGLPARESDAIRRALQGQWALGSDSFLDMLGGGAASRRPVAAKRGRPRKAVVSATGAEVETLAQTDDASSAHQALGKSV